MHEYFVIGWIIITMCVGFFALGESRQAGKPKNESYAKSNKEAGEIFLIFSGIGIAIWFFVF